jgi:hypothetical protein
MSTNPIGTAVDQSRRGGWWLRISSRLTILTIKAEFQLDKPILQSTLDQLRSKSAKKAAEIKGEVAKPAAQTNVLDEVVQYFRDNFGEVDPRALIEIVPMGHPVSIHVIRPTESRTHLTLFTTGLSSKRMNLPSELTDYALAELFIQLPADWKYESSQAQ